MNAKEMAAQFKSFDSNQAASFFDCAILSHVEYDQIWGALKSATHSLEQLIPQTTGKGMNAEHISNLSGINDCLNICAKVMGELNEQELKRLSEVEMGMRERFN